MKLKYYTREAAGVTDGVERCSSDAHLHAQPGYVDGFLTLALPALSFGRPTPSAFPLKVSSCPACGQVQVDAVPGLALPVPPEALR